MRDTRPRPELRTAFWPYALLLGALATAVVYWPVFTGRVPFPGDIVTSFPPWQGLPGSGVHLRHAEMGDLVTQNYPWRLFASRAFDQGELPLWNPHLLLGGPFLADPSTGVFWPLNWLDAVLPLPVSWTLGQLVVTLLTFLATALLARELGCARPAALLAATAFTFSAFVVSWQLWATGNTIRCLPLVLLGVARLERLRSPGAVALAAVGFALPVLAGHPQTALYDIGLGALFGLYLLVWRAAPGARLRFAGLLAAAGLLAMALAAAQLLPTVEWLTRVARSTDVAWWHHQPPGALASWLSRDTRASPNGVGVQIPEGASYVGMVALMLAPAAWLARRRGAAVGFLAAVALVGVTAVYGLGPAAWLARSLPVLRGLQVSRVLLLPVFAVPLLAGLGLTALLRQQEEAPREEGHVLSRRLVALSILAVLGCLALATALRGAAAMGVFRGLASSWLVALAAALVLVAAARRPRLARPAAWALLLVALFDQVHVAAGHVPGVERRSIFPPAPLFDFLSTPAEEPFRSAFLNDVVPANAALAYGVDDVGGYGYATRPAAAILGRLTGGRWNYLARYRVQALRYPGLLNLTNVRYLVAPAASAGTDFMESLPRRYRKVWSRGPVVVFENTGFLGRAFLVPWSGLRVVESETAAFETVTAPDFQPRSVVVTTRPVPEPRGPGARKGPPSAHLEAGLNRWSVDLDAAASSILVLTDLAYPGWSATLDGDRAELLTVDYAFKGVAVPPGEHRVELRFDPVSVRWGVRLSLAGLAVWGALVVWGARRRAAA